MEDSESLLSPTLPTPTVSDQYTANLASSQKSEGSLHSVTLAQIVNRSDLLPTPKAQDGKDGTKAHICDGIVQTDTVARAVINGGEIQTDNGTWGKFEPAIRRWEKITGHPAPAPTLPDGKDGSHRLSPLLTEWMMGLKPGYVTSPAIGLTRNEMLKVCGNGVVPQQAIMALSILLEEIKKETNACV